MGPARVIGAGPPGGDLLARCSWTCTATPPGSWDGAAARAAARGATPGGGGGWLPAAVPGTAAAALRAARVDGWEERDYDAEDWWFATSFAAAGEAVLIELDGVATIAELWCNGALVAQSSSMFVPVRAVVTGLTERNDLALCCRALAPRLARRAGRARWRNTLVERQALRTVRTTLLGRMPGWSPSTAPVGPWRPVRALPLDRPLLQVERLSSRPGPRGGVVELEALLHPGAGAGAGGPLAAELRVGDHAATAVIGAPVVQEAPRVPAATAPAAAMPAARVRASVTVPDAEPWWPHTHGAQPLLPVSLDLALGAAPPERLGLGAVGFAGVELDTGNGGFSLVVNGSPLFARGACWVPPDPVAPGTGRVATRRALEALRDAGCNLVRITGTTVYEDEDFFAACDELGLLVWQDCMLANLDPPEDDAWTSLLAAELDANLGPLAAHASLAVVCGGSEVTQQAAMSGVPRGGWRSRVLEEEIPAAVASLLPGVPYVRSTPDGGALPFRCDRGVAHYFGVGAYLRPLQDARRSGVRFAAECLAFSTPPEPASLEEWGVPPSVAGHHPDWKRGVPRDAGASWDFEDVTAHYVEQLFGVAERRLRYGDPARALELRRAAVAECFTAVLAEWRRPGSGCAGAIVLSARDLRPGAGWGVLDAAGRPKASWYVMRRLLAARALLVTDEGLNGLFLHLVNDDPDAVEGRLELRRYRNGEHLIDELTHDVRVPGRSACTLESDELGAAFCDLGYAYRFGPPAHDLVVARWSGAGGEPIGEWCFLPLGCHRPVEEDLGLVATVSSLPAGGYVLDCRAERFAHYVAVDVPGYRASDSWFHLPPGTTRRLRLDPEPRGASDGATPPSGEVRALNLAWPQKVRAPSGDAPGGHPAPSPEPAAAAG